MVWLMQVVNTQDVVEKLNFHCCSKRCVCLAVLGLAATVLVQTHALLDLSISCQFSSTILSSHLANRPSRKLVSWGRRRNIWLPLSTHCGYLALHRLLATHYCQRLPEGKVDEQNTSMERAKGRHRPHKALLWKGGHSKHLAERL